MSGANPQTPPQKQDIQYERTVVTVRTLLPQLSDAQLNDMKHILDGYCATVWRIYERLEQECPDVLDELTGSRRMKGKVDSSKQNL